MNMTQYATGPFGPQGGPIDFTGNNNLGIYNISDIQRYVLGARFLTWDGKVYKYSKAGATLNPDLGAKAYATQNLAYVTFAAGQTAAIGDWSLKCTFAATDGLANSGLVGVNELAGGTCVIF